MSQSDAFTLGVEEEYQVVDPQSRELSSNARSIIQAEATPGEGEDPIQPELHLCQVEIATGVCQTLADVRKELSESRSRVVRAARESGSEIVAAGTHPFSNWRDQTLSPKDRYYELADTLRQVVRELIIYGCHVHVGIEDREVAVQVVNRSRIYLPILLALSANSPFWMGQKTGYDSYRMEQWWRLPSAGPPPLFENFAEHNAVIQQFVDYGIVDDPTKIYWDIRLSERYPTVEFRVADVCATVDEAVMLAGLCRAIAQRAYDDHLAGQDYPKVRPSVLRAAMWQAARYGLGGELIDFELNKSLPAAETIKHLLDRLRPALEKAGDWDEVSGLVETTLTQGNAAQRQRKAYERTQSCESVVDFLIEETAR